MIGVLWQRMLEFEGIFHHFMGTEDPPNLANYLKALAVWW